MPDDERGPGRPSIPEESRRKPMTVSLSPEAIEELKAGAKRAGQSQGEFIETLLGSAPKPVMTHEPRDPWRTDQLVDAIVTVQNHLRLGIELGALDRNNVAPVQGWLIGLRAEIDKALAVRGVTAAVQSAQRVNAIGEVTSGE